jgi:hypothetical protein
MKSKNIAIILATVSLSTLTVTSSATAASFTIPITTINGTDVNSGPSFTVTSNFLGTDTISLNVSGTIDIARFDLPEGYTINAAGITTKPGRIFATPVPTGSIYSGGLVPGNYNYGALLIGNSTLGFTQLFAANTANGLGNPIPSSNLSLTNVSLNSIFGTGLTSGTVLQFRVADVFGGGDNIRAFTVNGSINGSTTSVPEPFTIVGTIIGSTAALRLRKKLKSAPNDRA